MRKISAFWLFSFLLAVTLVIVASVGGIAAAKQSSSEIPDKIEEPKAPPDGSATSNTTFVPFILRSAAKPPQQEEEVVLTLSDTLVQPGEPVTVTATNQSASTIATFDHKSLCSIFSIQAQIGENWEEVLPCGLVEKTKPVALAPGESLSLEFNGGSHFQDPGALDPGTYRVELMYKPIKEITDLISEEIPWQFAFSPTLTVAKPIPRSGAKGTVPLSEDLEIRGPFVSDAVIPHRFDGDLRGLATVEPQILSGINPLQFDSPDPNFDGLFNPPGVLVTPPDTVADVGPDHIIQAVNISYVIYDKQGNLLAGPFNINSLWAGFGGLCETQNDGDPYVLYDHLAGRWVISQFVAFTNQCIAVSQTPDPVAGGWFLYDFPTSGVVNDYPKLSLWPDAYYMGSQRGFLPAMTFGADAWAFDRGEMLLGNPATLIRFFDPGAFMLPSDLDGGTLPPIGAPNVFARVIDGAQFGGVDRLELRAFSVNFAAPASSTFTALPDLPTAAFDRDLCGFSLMGNCIPQPGTAQLLESLTAWLMNRLQYRNFGSYETLVVNHTVDVDGTNHAGIRWYELRKSGAAPWAIFQQADYSPDAEHRWMGSLAMDRNGNMALGYSVSSNTVFSSIRYAGRLAGDPAGNLPQGEFTLIAGNGAQTASNRWGDYSAMSLDPVDDCTFWFTTEYYPTTSPVSWSTRIGAFRFASCEADLSIIKSDSPDPVTAGDNLTYTLTVTNNGAGDATGVTVSDTLPAGVTLVSATPSQGTCSGSITCDLGSLDNGDVATITIVVTVDRTAPCGTITNTATVTGDQADPNTADNTASADTEVLCLSDLSITKSDSPDPVTAGDDLTYTLTVANNGPSDATGVTITDSLPAGVTLVSATPSQGSCSGSVNCDLGNLANGASATVTIVVTVEPTTPCGMITNAASVSGNETDPDTSNNTASEDTTVQVELALMIDSEGLLAGSIVNSVSVGNGISVVSGSCPVSGTVSVLGINPWFTDNAAMIYDSTVLTGDDEDLFGFMENKNLLIISEDLDQSDPDDNRTGGTFVFDFANFGPGEISIQSMEAFDIDPYEPGGTIVVEKTDGSVLPTHLPFTGDHSKETVSILDGESVIRMMMTLTGSGAFDNITFHVLVLPPP